MSKRKKSEVWDYFKVKITDPNAAVCNFCKTVISRGGGRVNQSYTTSNMLKHLRTFHKSDQENQKKEDENVGDSDDEESNTAGPSSNPTFDDVGLATATPMSLPREHRPTALASIFTSPRPSSEAEEIDTRSSTSTLSSGSCVPKIKPISSSPKQQTIQQVFAKTRPLSSTDSRAVKITRLIAEMICTDSQPISVVENPGFKRLLQFLEPRYTIPGRKYFSTIAIPNIYQKVSEKVRFFAKKAEHVSITTDMWSSTANIDYMSLTAHFLTEEMQQVHICLDVVPFPYESHNAANLAIFMKESLQRWGLLEKLNVIVRDNARNIVSAMEVGKFAHIPCLAHTLQLVVKDGCLDNAHISSLTATCRRIVGHFKHSVNSYKLLRKSQETLGLPKHSIIQDEPTRWNSTYHMLNRLIEQKDAILLVTPHFPTTARQSKELSAEEWDSLVPLVAALKVFEDVTLTASSAKVTTSEVIPIINAVNMSIDQIEDYGEFKEALTESLHRRYGDCEKEPIYAFATILDPRFKNKIFRSKARADRAVTRIIGELNALETDEALEITVSGSQECNTPAPSAVWSLYNKLINTNSAIHTAHRSMADEVAEYIKEPLLASHEDVFEYWRKSKFLNLKKLAQKYLGTPLSTVFSERLFSTAGLICDRKRSRLNPERVQMLVFLNKNLPFLNYQY